MCLSVFSSSASGGGGVVRGRAGGTRGSGCVLETSCGCAEPPTTDASVLPLNNIFIKNIRTQFDLRGIKTDKIPTNGPFYWRMAPLITQDFVLSPLATHRSHYCLCKKIGRRKCFCWQNISLATRPILMLVYKLHSSFIAMAGTIYSWLCYLVTITPSKLSSNPSNRPKLIFFW